MLQSYWVKVSRKQGMKCMYSELTLEIVEGLWHGRQHVRRVSYQSVACVSAHTPRPYVRNPLTCAILQVGTSKVVRGWFRALHSALLEPRQHERS